MITQCTGNQKGKFFNKFLLEKLRFSDDSTGLCWKIATENCAVKKEKNLKHIAKRSFQG